MALTLALAHGWKTRQVDYVLAFTQGEIDDKHLYMGLPRGMTVPGGGDPNDWVLHLKKNIYGRRESGLIWFKAVTKALRNIGFKQSKFDECVFYRGNVMYVLYCDDSIITGKTDKEIDQVIKDLKGQKLDLTDEGDIGDFLGVKIQKQSDGTMFLSQPHLIDQILRDCHMDNDDIFNKDTPLPSGKVVQRFTGSAPFDDHFPMRMVIGRMMYLEKASRPNISAAVHMLA
jgi:hypothetical protein